MNSVYHVKYSVRNSLDKIERFQTRRNENRVKKNQRNTTNENQICIEIYIMITNISVCKTDLLQGNIN